MGLFDGMFGGQEPKELTKQEAYAGILLAANASDGHVSDEEVQGFITILLRMKMFKDWQPEKIQKCIDRMVSRVKKHGPDKVLESCAEVLPESLHKSVFANAVDLILADGVVEQEEKEFINKLRKALQMSGDDAQNIAQVMVWKNQG